MKLLVSKPNQNQTRQNKNTNTNTKKKNKERTIAAKTHPSAYTCIMVLYDSSVYPNRKPTRAPNRTTHKIKLSASFWPTKSMADLIHHRYRCAWCEVRWQAAKKRV